MNLLPQQSVSLIWPQQTRIVVMTISFIAAATTEITVVTIPAVVITIEFITTAILLFAGAVVTKRFIEATKLFSP